MEAVLVLEDATVFYGESCGIQGEVGGEVVFSTAMTGYQEIITDPSFAGQLITFTYPLIGNYGTSSYYQEANKPVTKGVIIKEATEGFHGRIKGKLLQQFLKENNLVGIKGVDTRTLTKHIRNHGTMRGIISSDGTPLDILLARVKKLPLIIEQRLVEEVSTTEKYIVPGGWPTIAVLDLGVKSSIIKALNKLGCTVVVMPSSSSAEEIMAIEPDALLVSNGPGNPELLTDITATVKELLGVMPIMGICLGHQVLGIAMGLTNYKMKFGHRGGNQPVKDLKTGKVFITSQNHGFCLSSDNLPEDVLVSHINLNDGSIEGIRHASLPAFSVQFHPEGSPGPMDSLDLFAECIRLIETKSGGGGYA